MKIEREHLISELDGMRKAGFTYLVKITAVDYGKYIEAVYIVRNMDEGKEEMLEVDFDSGDAWVPSVLKLFKAADWYEREMGEMFGIEIKNRHSDRLLLEKWNGKGAPLRKNFAWGEPYEKGA